MAEQKLSWKALTRYYWTFKGRTEEKTIEESDNGAFVLVVDLAECMQDKVCVQKEDFQHLVDLAKEIKLYYHSPDSKIQNLLDKVCALEVTHE